jgi:hypothetical protein
LIFFHLFDESFDCIDQTTLSKADQSLITFWDLEDVVKIFHP